MTPIMTNAIITNPGTSLRHKKRPIIFSASMFMAQRGQPRAVFFSR